MITIGAEGSVDGWYGITLGSSAAVRSFGSIAGLVYGVELVKAGARRIVNSGSIQAGLAIADIDGLGTAKVNDVTVNGIVTGTIDLGTGDDRMTGGDSAERVSDGDGTDTINLGGGNDTYLATGHTRADGLDSIEGGSGIDIFDGSAATSSLIINLDMVAHDLSPFSPRANPMAAGTAMGMQTGSGHFSGFENARGGSVGDTIYGSNAANRIKGNGGTDILFGYAGNDNLDGGTSFDILTGGADADSFTFLAISDSGRAAATRDVITDFEDFRDVIALDFIDADPGTTADDAFTFIGTKVGFGGNAGELRAVWTAGGERCHRRWRGGFLDRVAGRDSLDYSHRLGFFPIAYGHRKTGSAYERKQQSQIFKDRV